MNGRLGAEQMAAEHEARNCQRWIPVSERLPDGEEDVLASYEHSDGSRSVDIGWFTTLANPREWRHYAASRRDMIPTHWMPLPPPPTDAK